MPDYIQPPRKFAMLPVGHQDSTGCSRASLCPPRHSWPLASYIFHTSTIIQYRYILYRYTPRLPPPATLHTSAACSACLPCYKTNNTRRLTGHMVAPALACTFLASVSAEHTFSHSAGQTQISFRGTTSTRRPPSPCHQRGRGQSSNTKPFRMDRGW